MLNHFFSVILEVVLYNFFHFGHVFFGAQDSSSLAADSSLSGSLGASVSLKAVSAARLCHGRPWDFLGPQRSSCANVQLPWRIPVADGEPWGQGAPRSCPCGSKASMFCTTAQVSVMGSRLQCSLQLILGCGPCAPSCPISADMPPFHSPVCCRGRRGVLIVNRHAGVLTRGLKSLSQHVLWRHDNRHW